MIYCSFLVLILLFPIIHSGPTASCNSTATDTCCKFNTFSNLSDDIYIIDAFSRCSLGHCVICGQTNSANTADAATTQSSIDRMASLYNQNQCWNGYIAENPGSQIQFLNQRDFVCSIKNAACAINFYVPYAYDCAPPTCPTSGGESIVIDSGFNLRSVIAVVSLLFLI